VVSCFVERIQKNTPILLMIEKSFNPKVRLDGIRPQRCFQPAFRALKELVVLIEDAGADVEVAGQKRPLEQELTGDRATGIKIPPLLFDVRGHLLEVRVLPVDRSTTKPRDDHRAVAGTGPRSAYSALRFVLIPCVRIVCELRQIRPL
jgi:hypothetical protein